MLSQIPNTLASEANKLFVVPHCMTLALSDRLPCRAAVERRAGFSVQLAVVAGNGKREIR